MATPDEMDRWRRDLQQLHTYLLNTRVQFTAWTEELDMTEGALETGEFRDCVTEIKLDLQQYRQLMTQLPKVEEFTDEEVEKRIGKAGQLLNIGNQVSTLEIHVPRKLEKLQFCASSCCNEPKHAYSCKNFLTPSSLRNLVNPPSKILASTLICEIWN
jgi:hypothetical protein